MDHRALICEAKEDQSGCSVCSLRPFVEWAYASNHRASELNLRPPLTGQDLQFDFRYLPSEIWRLHWGIRCPGGKDGEHDTGLKKQMREMHSVS